MTSSVSCEVMSWNVKFVLIISNIEFQINQLARSRGIDVLGQTGNRFFKPEVDTQTQKNYIFSVINGHAEYKNIFCFQIGAKLRYITKVCKFCKF